MNSNSIVTSFTLLSGVGLFWKIFKTSLNLLHVFFSFELDTHFSLKFLQLEGFRWL